MSRQASLHVVVFGREKTYVVERGQGEVAREETLVASVDGSDRAQPGCDHLVGFHRRTQHEDAGLDHPQSNVLRFLGEHLVVDGARDSVGLQGHAQEFIGVLQLDRVRVDPADLVVFLQPPALQLDEGLQPLLLVGVRQRGEADPLRGDPCFDQRAFLFHRRRVGTEAEEGVLGSHATHRSMKLQHPFEVSVVAAGDPRGVSSRFGDVEGVERVPRLIPPASAVTLHPESPRPPDRQNAEGGGGRDREKKNDEVHPSLISSFVPLDDPFWNRREHERVYSRRGGSRPEYDPPHVAMRSAG